MSAAVRDPDFDVIDQIRGGNHDAFAVLVTRYQRAVFALAYRMVRHQEEAADLTQEIFTRVWIKLDTFRGESKFSTWMFQLAGNHCKNRLKALQRRHYFQHDSLDSANGDDEAPVRQFASDEPDSAQKLHDARMKAIVRRKLAILPEDQRLALTLRDVDDLDYDQIADATGWPLGTIKSRIHRGRLELARLVKMELSGDGSAAPSLESK